MLYHLLPQFSDVHIIFNLFIYLTFRAAGAVVTSLLLAFVLGPMTIRWLKRMEVGQVVRDDGPETHFGKAGTPTMGGVLIIMSAALSTLLWADLTNGFTLVALSALLWMGLLGFLDDYLKVV
ncbi:MAG: phospho-N-acetylmuramoyl-pentapeptide-transferase, partial [Gemmatimonadota bacterium]